MDFTKINPIAGMICVILNDYKFDGYLVGGCVRDLIMGRTPKDWDICTNALPASVMTLFKEKGFNIVPTGIKHGTVTVIEPNTGESFEVTTYRIDGEYSDGRHPDNVTFTNNLNKDLARRDFTMNAIAIGHSSELGYFIHDPFDGAKDIEKKIIRCVGQPLERFSEDALRMMRAIRFSCQLDFSISEDTFDAICKLNAKICSISWERMRDELTKIIMTPNGAAGIELMNDADLLRWVLPEIEALTTCTQSKPWHLYDVFEHTMKALKAVCKPEVDLQTRLAVLYHDTGKPATKTVDDLGVCHFYGHPAKSEKIVRMSLSRLRFPNDIIDEVANLVFYHDTEMIPTKVSVKRLVQNLLCPKLYPKLVTIRKADVSAQNPARIGDRIDRANECFRLYQEVMSEGTALKVTDLEVNGHDIMDFGYKGIEVGNILRGLLELVTDEVVENKRSKLLALIKFKTGNNDNRG